MAMAVIGCSTLLALFECIVAIIGVNACDVPLVQRSVSD